LHPGGVPYQNQATRPDIAGFSLQRLVTRVLPQVAFQRGVVPSNLWVGPSTATIWSPPQRSPLPIAGGNSRPINLIFFPLAVLPPAPPPDPIPGGNDMPVNMVFFTATGTYTPSPGMVSAIVECVGGGGGGGGALGNGTHSGGGGGSGGYSRVLLSAAEVGGTQAVQIGAGGAAGATGNGSPGGVTSFGALCIANGGMGGFGYDGTSQFGVAGPGAVAGTIAFNRGFALPGSGGGYGGPISTGGYGAALLGGGPIQPDAGGPGGQTAGFPGQYGAGGSGGCASLVTTGLWIPGGAGGTGWCCITEYS
jgi:hypothetical protein